MSDPRLADDAELLARAVRGELAPGDAELRELFRRRPDWSEVLAELADGAHEGAPAELRALARANETERDREHMHALVKRVAAGAVGPRAHPRWRLPLLLAAALVLALGAGWWFARPRPETRGPFLGSDAITWVAPLDTVETWGTFEWSAELPRRGSYTLTVRSDDAKAELLERVEGLQAGHWTPDPVTAGAWPDAIVVTVERIDPRQGVLDSRDKHLRRSRP